MSDNFTKHHNTQKKHSHNFTNIPINPKSFRNKNNKKGKFKKIFLLTFLSIILSWIIISLVWIRINVTSQLPDVSSIQNMIFSEATLIQDRHGETLYKIFQENRDYVEYDKISPILVDALVSIEDKNYWEHNGLDAIGLLKVAIHNFSHPNDMRGGSTISQQLLKNLLLNKDGKRETFKERVIRKLKEFFLTSKLSDTLENKIRKEHGKMSKEEIHTEMKRKTLELYLNYISFGNNAYGIEAAAKTYFWKSAIDLDAMESSVLASLPKWPSYYNPYRHKDRIMWELIILDIHDEIVPQWSGFSAIQDSAIKKLSNMIMTSNISNMRNDEAFVDFIKWLGSFSIFNNGQNYKVEYKPWRKDVVLARMYDDGYINEPEIKNAFIKGINYKFRKHKFEIKAPHFVHRVTEWLEDDYDKETLMNGWFIIKTTLDLNIQHIAEKAIENNLDTLDYYGASDEALIYLDSLNGDVLAYVGSRDYFNDEIGWQNDMLRSPRQVWSSIKPLIYAIWFEKIWLTTETPIYDIPFKIWKDQPNNADGKFYGILPLRNALAYSRNIPAIKVFLWFGGEDVAKPILQKMWMTSLIDEHKYWYPMALWAWEIDLLELASAYMHLSARGKPAEINPILEIRTKDGALVYQKEVKQQEEVLKPGVAYLLWSILSNKANMPWSRVPKYSVPWLNLAIKSGTSNMKNKNNQNRARDGLLVWYTPSKVLITRWWNADGSPMNRNAYGWFLNADVLREFLWNLKKNNYISNENMSAIETTSVQISKINGWIAGENTPSEFTINAATYAYKLPWKLDPGMTPIVYDKLCNGKISPYTPAADIGHGYIAQASSFMLNNMDLKDIKERRTESLAKTGSVNNEEKKRPRITYNYNNIFLAEPTEVCKDRVPKTDDSISIEIRQPQDWQSVTTSTSITFSANSSKRNIQSVIIFVDNEQSATFEYKNKSNITDIQPIDLNSLKIGKHKIRVEAVDVRGYGNWKTIEITTVEKDTEAPILQKDKIKIKKQDNGNYEIMLLFEDKLSSIIGWKIFQNDKTIKEFEWNLAVFEIENLSTISIAVTDSFKNILQEDIDLSKY